MIYLKSKLKDPLISRGQVEQILKAHTPDAKLSWSVDNYLYYLSTDAAKGIKKPFPVFMSHIKDVGYFEDYKQYIKSKDESDDSGDLGTPEGLYEALMANDLDEAKRIAHKASNKNTYTLDEAQKIWFESWLEKVATQSEKDRFHGKPQRKIFEYYIANQWIDDFEFAKSKIVA